MTSGGVAAERDVAVVVIGGGFSGAMTAAHLVGAGVDTVVVEPGALGRGVAYSAPPWLLLNTPSAAMSALPDVPSHFVDWLGARDPRREVPRFAPRAVYGDYVGETIRQVAGRTLEVAPARARAVTRDGDRLHVVADDGTRLRARHVVLALGNAPPRRPAVLAGDVPGYLADPYAAAIQLPCDDRTVVLLGTGLTALDVLVSLRERGHRGRIVLLSRRGLVPLVHGVYPGVAAVPPALLATPTLAGLLAWWRANLRAGVSGPPQIDALRPHIPAVWSRLSLADRATFVRHVRPRWEVVRHRAPPPIRGVLDAGLADGSTAVVAARLTRVERSGEGVRVSLLPANGQATAIDAAWLVNCTGPERDLARLASPLVTGLLADGLVTRDPLGLGARSDDDGLASPGVSIVGGWRAADRWESTAVGELRGQAGTTARAIAATLSRGGPGSRGA